MHLTVTAPYDTSHHAQVRAVPGRTLAAWCASHHSHVTGCLVNDTFVEGWQAYVPQETDQITLFLETGISAAVGAAILYGAIATVVGTAVSLALSYVIKALTPTPHPETPAARTEGKTEQIYGIAGMTNTTAQGTPKFFVYGARRVYGHILSTRVECPDPFTMRFAILYFMGEGPIYGLAEPQINDISTNQYAPSVDVLTRNGGADNATLIHTDFSTLSQVWSDGRQLPLSTQIVYQTKNARTNKVTLIVSIPLLRTESTTEVPEGGEATMVFQVDATSIAVNSYTTLLPAATITQRTLVPVFFPLTLTLSHADQWLIRITLVSSDNQGGVLPTLFNVMEEQDGDQRYPNNVLMAFRGIASSQITSFDAMRGSALEYGLLIPVWNGTGFTTQWSNQRAWVLRHLLTDPRIGLGHRIPASLFDHLAAQETQLYWDEFVSADEHRDSCDLLVNDRRPGWDWIKLVLAEGRATMPPSNNMFKLIPDRDGAPGLLYSLPGNIVDGSVTHSLGSGGGLLPNHVLVQFPDKNDNYQPHVYPYRAEGTDAEPLRDAAALTLYTFTRFAHAYWFARAMLLRQRQVLRRVSWQSPSTALVSEPLDHIALSYEMPTFTRGISGFLSADSTTSRLVLDRPILLDAGQAYTVLVRHQRNNLVESRTVANGAGYWGALIPGSVLTAWAPEAGDLWALGVTDTALLHLLVESVRQSEDLVYTLSASEYAPALYQYPAPPVFGTERGTPFPPVLPPPTEAPVPPAVPEAPVLSGSFGLSGTITLDWTIPGVSPGDSIVWFQLYFSLGDETSFVFYADVGLTTHYATVVTELTTGWFAVRALSNLAGWSPLSNHVLTAWA